MMKVGTHIIKVINMGVQQHYRGECTALSIASEISEYNVTSHLRSIFSDRGTDLNSSQKTFPRERQRRVRSLRVS